MTQKQKYYVLNAVTTARKGEMYYSYNLESKLIAVQKAILNGSFNRQMESFKTQKISNNGGPRALGERRLLIAIIERAVLDAGGSMASTIKKGSNNKYKFLALGFLFGWEEGDEKEPFSFPWICIELDLDPMDTSKRIEKYLATEERVSVPTKRKYTKDRLGQWGNDDLSVYNVYAIRKR